MTTNVKTTSPNDFIILEKYFGLNNSVIEGNFPIYIRSASSCCKDAGKPMKVSQIVIPKP